MNVGDKPQDRTFAISNLEQVKDEIKKVISSIDSKIRSLPETNEKEFVRGFRDGLARSVIECDKQISLLKN